MLEVGTKAASSWLTRPRTMSDADLACVGDACPRFDGGRVAAAPLLPTTLTTRRAAAVSVAPRGALEPARQYTWKVGAHVPISTHVSTKHAAAKRLE